MAAEADAESEMLIDVSGPGAVAVVLAAAEHVALEGVDEQGVVGDHAGHDAEHVLGVLGIALAPGVVGQVRGQAGAVVALVPGGGDEPPRPGGGLAVPGVEGQRSDGRHVLLALQPRVVQPKARDRGGARRELGQPVDVDVQAGDGERRLGHVGHGDGRSQRVRRGHCVLVKEGCGQSRR